MPTARSYGEACGIPRALDRIGERWALMVVRELLLGPKRFTDLKTGLPGASPNALAQRLRELEAAGVVRRRTIPPPAASRVYELTEWGHELEPVLTALGRWGARAPAPPEEHGMSLDAHILSLRTLFDAELAGDFSTSLELRLGQHDFRATVGEGRLEITRGAARSPEAIVKTDAGTLLALAHRRRELADALGKGEIEIDGDRRAVERFLGLFPLPEPAEPSAA
jgi:DNA-binding HxlR family transcriptional regulator/putative sterol carrier protein